MMLVCALGALGAVGCVGTSDAADEAAVAQNTGGGGALFDCKNVASISVVQCVGSILSANVINVNVKDVNVLSGDQLKVLDDDLNNLNIGDINILNVNDVLNKVQVTALNDFLTKFNINVDKNNLPIANDIDVCALVGIAQICKNG
ncbi:MAG TPA: hypothetical protein VF516_29025 [Kofleriaceae bacterium]